jgi:hypothetical protein
VLNCKHCN